MKIEFYVLETASSQKSLYFACQLLEKIYSIESRKILVRTQTRDEAVRFDALLWTYRDDSFLPHHVYDPAVQDHPAILITDGTAPAVHQDILMNLGEDIPAFHNQFQQIIEIVFSDPHVQQLARARYKQYRQLGYDINTIKLKASES
ncbi:DNA polymerase III subunit chi [Aquicella siphonis]|uniref:DNA polymerase III subunit chi n=1 Tax=Aquicella siphonis TaxID=254247 RepID=A0A5E4PG29_9COXI|nr:DNA polymerase III subunit chi [Aquicella siphonis]VVC75794.1 DNA polymerase III subunit chi [Aquicella siphonis]